MKDAWLKWLDFLSEETGIPANKLKEMPPDEIEAICGVTGWNLRTSRLGFPNHGKSKYLTDEDTDSLHERAAQIVEAIETL